MSEIPSALHRLLNAINNDPDVGPRGDGVTEPDVGPRGDSTVVTIRKCENVALKGCDDAEIEARGDANDPDVGPRGDSYTVSVSYDCYGFPKVFKVCGEDLIKQSSGSRLA